MSGVLLADVISFIHAWILSFVCIVPFIGEMMFVLLNLVFMFGIMVHWYFNSNVCALTLLEKAIRGVADDGQTFFGQIFGKVYTVSNDSPLYWYGIIFLVIVSMIKIFSYDKWELVFQRVRRK
jgi:hypothetical protein